MVAAVPSGLSLTALRTTIINQYSLRHRMQNTELGDKPWLLSDPFNKGNYVMDLSH
jgi:hypothetical protein